MMLRISIAVIVCLPFLASAQWTTPPTVTNAAGSWTNTPGSGVVVPGPNVEPDTVKPGPATESWRRHVGQTGDAHGGIVMAPTNAALTGWALRYSATGRPYYAPVQASDLVTGYTTNQDNSITTNTALDTFNAHVDQTTAAHGGIMRSASNPGANGQVLLLNGTTGRPYWGDPETGSAAQTLLTSGVARVNGRYASTNYTVTVSNGTWDGVTAILSETGSVTIAANVPLSRWEYDHTTANGIGLTDLIDAGTWETNAHGLITRGDVYTVMIQAAAVSGAPSPDGGFDTEITVSNLAVWTWGAAPLTGSTNDFQGIVTEIDDPATELNPVNLRTMQAAIVAINTAPGAWANYDANGAPNRIDGVNIGGRRVYLDSQWSLLGSGRYCALYYNGKDIFYISMSNQLLSVSQIIPGDLIRINVATNGVTSKPWIEWTSDLVAGNWMEITNATSTYPVKTNGTYLMTFSNVWTSAFFRTVQASSNVSALVATVPIDARGGLTLGSVTRTNWPAILQPVTNISMTITTNLNIMTMTITNIGGGGGGIGSFTNVQINGVTHSNGVVIGDSETTTWVQDSNGVWRVQSWSSVMPSTWDGDLIGTNSLDIKVGGMRMLEFTTNGIIMHHGTIQMYEEQLWANVELYDGTRLAPSLTFHGHPNEWGLYARGYNGNYVAGWSIAGVEQGLLGRGVILMDTNAAFVGRLVGDISGATGYPEPIFMNWYTNQWVFNALSISNLTMLNGPITVKDSLYTTRGTLDTTGLTVKDAGAATRSIYGAQSVTLKNTSGLTTTTLDTSLKIKDPTSGNTLLDFGGGYGDSIIGKTPTGFYQFYLSTAGGLHIFDQGSYAFRSSITPYGITLMNGSSQLVFSVDSQASLRTICNDFGVTNSGNINMYGPNGTNLFTITGSTGAVKIRGVDSDLRYVTNVRTNMTGFQLTNLWAGVTNILWYNSQGIVTNKTP